VTTNNSLFGKSRAKRFGKDEKDVPGPNAYSIPSTLKVRNPLPGAQGSLKLPMDAPAAAEMTSEQSRSQSNNDAKKSGTLIWRRKYIPASIPKGNNIYGYRETKGR
jgi:hypothetical protein